MTVLQSVCSHGQQAFNTGDPIKREQPLFVRMPPDGPDESREVWVQLLKTVNGLADGTREWRNCFLATARGLGFRILVLRGSQQRNHGIIGVAVDDIAGGGDEVWEHANFQDGETFHVWSLESGKGSNSVAERSYKQQMGPCALDSLPFSRVWTLCLSEK